MMEIPTVPAWQLALRFALELTSVWAIASATRAQAEGSMLGWVACIGAGAVVVVAWGVFNVPGDPSRSGQAPIVVSGATRIALEVLVFIAGAIGLATMRRWTFFAVFVTVAIVHHAGTVPRLRWMLSRRATH